MHGYSHNHWAKKVKGQEPAYGGGRGQVKSPSPQRGATGATRPSPKAPGGDHGPK